MYASKQSELSTDRYPLLTANGKDKRQKASLIRPPQPQSLAVV